MGALPKNLLSSMIIVIFQKKLPPPLSWEKYEGPPTNMVTSMLLRV